MRKILIPIVVILSIPLNGLLIYSLLWNPYSLYFDRPEFSETDFPTRFANAFLASWGNIILLSGATVWMIVHYFRKKKLLFIAPVVSALTIFMMRHAQTYYPDSLSEFTGDDGYGYRIEEWYLEGKNIYKRWKSKKLANHYKYRENIVWKLDSADVK